MARQAVILRPATPEDLPVLLEMSRPLQQLGPRTHRTARSGSDSAREVAAERYLAAMASDQHRLLVAILPDGVVGGMTLLVRTDFGQVLDAPVIHVAQTSVHPEHRRRGVGRALVSAAAIWAEETDSASVVLSVQPGARESHRYYARLGFAPMVMLRSAPLSSLRRALGMDNSRPAISRRRALAPVRVRRARRVEQMQVSERI